MFLKSGQIIATSRDHTLLSVTEEGKSPFREILGGEVIIMIRPDQKSDGFYKSPKDGVQSNTIWGPLISRHPSKYVYVHMYIHKLHTYTHTDKHVIYSYIYVYVYAYVFLMYMYV